MLIKTGFYLFNRKNLLAPWLRRLCPTRCKKRLKGTGTRIIKVYVYNGIVFFKGVSKRWVKEQDIFVLHFQFYFALFIQFEVRLAELNLWKDQFQNAVNCSVANIGDDQNKKEDKEQEQEEEEEGEEQKEVSEDKKYI